MTAAEVVPAVVFGIVSSVVLVVAAVYVTYCLVTDRDLW